MLKTAKPYFKRTTRKRCKIVRNPGPVCWRKSTVTPHSQPWGVSRIWFYDTHSVGNTKYHSQVLRPPLTKRNANTWRGETKHIFLKRAKNVRMSSGNFRSRELQYVVKLEYLFLKAIGHSVRCWNFQHYQLLVKHIQHLSIIFLSFSLLIGWQLSIWNCWGCRLSSIGRLPRWRNGERSLDIKSTGK
jgi:hypothetical protein